MLNKCQFIGNLGSDPDVRTMQSGDKVVNLSIAITERWKKDGERKERTEWIRVVIFNQGIVNVCEKYLKKGAKVYIEGQLETRSWEQDGQKKYVTEVVLRPYRGELTMLDKFEKSDNATPNGYSSNFQAQAPIAQDEFEDSIPF